MKNSLQIEVVYAEPARQALIDLSLDDGATVADALKASGIAEKFPDVDFALAELGIWGRRVDRSQRLQDGDRLEIYRPLQMDPRDARRQLALHGRAMGQKDDGAD
ncbi:MAG: RnfH family protein [Woeseia sp.]